MIRRYTKFFILLPFVVSCSSLSKASQPKFFEKFSQLPIGSSLSVVIEQLGQPSQLSNEEDGTVAVYEFYYKAHSQQLPRATLWLDKDHRVIAKYISLFKEAGDSMTRAEAEVFFKGSKFVVEDAPIPKGAHYVPSEKFLEDKTNGISIQFRPHMPSIDNIHWYRPDTRNLTSSEKSK